ncbi:hypothetical protein C8Q72DRAFT_1360 [Fomitopsis betulina]|nr:hypothetical protein C8Q72DRAFT_1360 [Fomitopsis betulina]
MLLTDNLLLLAAILLSLCLYQSRRGNHMSPRTSLPPGPPPFPVVGNTLQLLHDFKHRTLGQWTQLYGDLIFLRVFRQPTLVIGSLQAAKDLLEVKGAKYSDRPLFHFARIIELS